MDLTEQEIQPYHEQPNASGLAAVVTETVQALQEEPGLPPSTADFVRNKLLMITDGVKEKALSKTEEGLGFVADLAEQMRFISRETRISSGFREAMAEMAEFMKDEGRPPHAPPQEPSPDRTPSLRLRLPRQLVNVVGLLTIALVSACGTVSDFDQCIAAYADYTGVSESLVRKSYDQGNPLNLLRAPTDQEAMTAQYTREVIDNCVNNLKQTEATPSLN